MSDISSIAPAFVDMAHHIVWATVATVDTWGRPRGRIMHPYWQWDGTTLTGWIATSPTPIKRAHLDNSPFVSVTYWTPAHDTCTAECRATWILDDAGREEVWRMFVEAPEPVRYDPATMPPWAGGPMSAAFAGLCLEPWRLRVLPGSLGEGGKVLTWAADAGDA